MRILALTVMLASPAAAVEWIVDAAVSTRATSDVDLAELGGSTDYGAANDAGPMHLGVLVTGGVRAFDTVEVLVSAGIALGGIALGAVEERYFESEDQALGGTSTIELNGALMWSHAPADRWRVLAGVSSGVHAMNAASPAGNARVASFRTGVAAALRIPMPPDRYAASGHLQLWTDYSLHLPMRVLVETGNSELVESTDPSGSFTSAAFLIGYGFTFR